MRKTVRRIEDQFTCDFCGEFIVIEVPADYDDQRQYIAVKDRVPQGWVTASIETHSKEFCSDNHRASFIRKFIDDKYGKFLNA